MFATGSFSEYRARRKTNRLFSLQWEEGQIIENSVSIWQTETKRTKWKVQNGTFSRRFIVAGRLRQMVAVVRRRHVGRRAHRVERLRWHGELAVELERLPDREGWTAGVSQMPYGRRMSVVRVHRRLVDGRRAHRTIARTIDACTVSVAVGILRDGRRAGG